MILGGVAPWALLGTVRVSTIIVSSESASAVLLRLATGERVRVRVLQRPLLTRDEVSCVAEVTSVLAAVA